MNHGHTKESLIAFEQQVADAFLLKRIKAPVHLSGGNEEQLLRIFKDVQPHDWVFSTWRSHYHALLKGIPETWVFDEILAGRSMYLINKEYRFFCSAIVGGILPIACGVAAGINRDDKDRQKSGLPNAACTSPSGAKVWAFVGDMTAASGLFTEFHNYCRGHGLPVRIVIEDNGYSTDTPTQEAWGESVDSGCRLDWYKYSRVWPHVGVGKHVAF